MNITSPIKRVSDTQAACVGKYVLRDMFHTLGGFINMLYMFFCRQGPIAGYVFTAILVMGVLAAGVILSLVACLFGHGFFGLQIPGEWVVYAGGFLVSTFKILFVGFILVVTITTNIKLHRFLKEKWQFYTREYINDKVTTENLIKMRFEGKIKSTDINLDRYSVVEETVTEISKELKG